VRPVDPGLRLGLGDARLEPAMVEQGKRLTGPHDIVAIGSTAPI
jgi:hypothetical protein